MEFDKKHMSLMLIMNGLAYPFSAAVVLTLLFPSSWNPSVPATGEYSCGLFSKSRAVSARVGELSRRKSHRLRASLFSTHEAFPVSSTA